MGMDVWGQRPTSKEGEYFRNSVWFWRPLADYAQEVAPKECKPCKSWHYNDGDGLNEKQANRLAEKLEQELYSGRCAAYADEYKKTIDALPLVPCKICDGTGKRLPVPQVGAGDEPCRACDNTGKQPDHDTHYPFTTENVREFVEFLKHSGGFEIW